MTYFDQELQKLQEQITQAHQLDGKLRELRSQQEILSSRLRELSQRKAKEQADVDRLEGATLVSIIARITGKLDEKLDQERREAYAAKAKYDAAVGELEAVKLDLERYGKEYSRLKNSERLYEQVLQQKTEAVKQTGGAAAEQIFQLEEQIGYLNNQKRELREAVSAGSTALNTTKEILRELDEAEGWGTIDLIGGGLLTDLAKHGHLDKAQNELEQLQSQLRRFKTELADVTIQADMKINIEGFLLFSDYFFDGLFADWAVLDKIGQSQRQVQETKGTIEQVLMKLQEMETAVDQKIGKMEREKEEVVKNY